jgi:hypothetical protein
VIEGIQALSLKVHTGALADLVNLVQREIADKPMRPVYGRMVTVLEGLEGCALGRRIRHCSHTRSSSGGALRWSTLPRAADQVKAEQQQLFERIADQCRDVTRCQIELSFRTALKTVTT